MYNETKKLHLIEEILKIEDEAVLAEVEDTISKSKKHAESMRSFKDFAGMMSEEEIGLLEKTIDEGCETIHPNDWK